MNFASHTRLLLVSLLPLLAACGSKNSDTLIGKNVDMNAIVETNADDLNSAENDLAATQEPSKQASEVATAQRQEPQTPSSSKAQAHSPGATRAITGTGDSEAVSVNQVQDNQGQDSNLE